VALLVGGYLLYRARRFTESRRPALFCPHCGTVGQPRMHTKGSVAIEIVLWLCFLVPGLLYSLWRVTSREPRCAGCGHPGLIPADSPRARQMEAS
jgi:uncharacterized membrane protein YqaE (UPF0057 family)